MLPGVLCGVFGKGPGKSGSWPAGLCHVSSPPSPQHTAEAAGAPGEGVSSTEKRSKVFAFPQPSIHCPMDSIPVLGRPGRHLQPWGPPCPRHLPRGFTYHVCITQSLQMCTTVGLDPGLWLRELKLRRGK